jgi:hypothetical protein
MTFEEYMRKVVLDYYLHPKPAQDSLCKKFKHFFKSQKISLKIKPKIFFHPKPNKELELRPKIPFEMKKQATLIFYHGRSVGAGFNLNPKP